MPLKGRGSKALVKGSFSRTPKGARNENLPINPPVQHPSIPKAPVKASIDGIPFNAFSTKLDRDLYTKSYLKSSLFGIVVKVTPEVVVKVLSIPLVDAPSMSELEIIFELLDRIEGALSSRKKVCHHRAKVKIVIFLDNLLLAEIELIVNSKCALEEEGEKLKGKCISQVV
ncbi:hypothetical protein AAG906_004478 [Vitis piasezkii]